MSLSAKLAYFPPEWHPQSAVHLVWPSSDSDWQDDDESVTQCYLNLVDALIGRQTLLLIFPYNFDVDALFSQDQQASMMIVYGNYNDTWVRDYGGLSVFKYGEMHLLDFKFNGWGGKFKWELDNKQTAFLFQQSVFEDQVIRQDKLDFVLEGGSIETNGEGLLLVTESCLLNPNRNPALSHIEIEKELKETFSVKEVLWLKQGKMMGDDTDGHVDTLVRFVSKDTLVYVKCTDPQDVHHQMLLTMEKELWAMAEEHHLKLVALPMPKAVFCESTKERLPATYANFLIVNGAVLMPSYDDEADAEAQQVLQGCFSDREIVSIDCRALIRQGGSLHCATMQYPLGFVKQLG